jgi:hypothetical protein
MCIRDSVGSEMCIRDSGCWICGFILRADGFWTQLMDRYGNHRATHDFHYHFSR